jgi:hypothetical protein
MNTNRNPLWPALDAFDLDLSTSGTRDAMQRLVASLAAQRAAMPTDAWRAACAAIDGHPSVLRLLEDPYSRDARSKPAGYAGDARTLDYVYLRDPGPQPLTPAGRTIFDVSTGVPIAEAVRSRSERLAEIIAARAGERAIRVSSIACGHARELDRLPDPLRGRVQFWGIDQDPESIDYCRSRLDPTHATFETGSVRDILAGRIRIPKSDVIYASGLFDYLDTRAGALLVNRMLAAANVGGSVIVPNLSPRSEEIGYMEAVMDWWMCYRTEADMRELLPAGAADRCRAATFVTSDERVAWLTIDRLI